MSPWDPQGYGLYVSPSPPMLGSWGSTIGNCDPQSGIAQILARRRRLYRPLKGLYRRCIYR